MLDELDDLLDKVCGDAEHLSDGDSIERLHRALARLEAATMVASAAFDAAGGWQCGTGPFRRRVDLLPLRHPQGGCLPAGSAGR